VSDLSPEARALLAAASHADDPTPADQDRVARALAAPLGLAALAPAAAQAAAVSAASTATVTALKVAAVVAALVAVGLGAHGRATPGAPPRTQPASVSAAPPHPVAAAQPPVAPARVAPVIAPVVAPVIAPAAAEARGGSHAPRASSVTVDTLQAEIALLGEAHRALNSGDAAGALAHLTAYRERFPHGVLREERDVEHVLVLCRLGRDGEARDAARAFLRSHPRSPLAPRVERACAGTSSGEGL
jgi:hypothetical protein